MVEISSKKGFENIFKKLSEDSEEHELTAELLYHKGLTLRDLEFELPTSIIINGQILNLLKIDNCNFSNIKISDCKIQHTHILNCDELSTVEIFHKNLVSDYFGEIKIESSKANRVIINGRSSNPHYYADEPFKSIKENSLELSGCKIKEALSLEWLGICSLGIYDTELKQSSLFNIQILESLEVLRTSLGDMSWSKVDMENAYPNLFMSSFRTSITSQISWPHLPKSFPYYNNPRRATSIKQARSSCLILKRICQESYHFDQAEIYHGYSLYLYFLESYIGANFVKKLELIFNIGLPYLISNFGQKLIRPILILLLSHFLWTWRLIVIQGTDFEVSMMGFLNWDSWNLYFYTINPVHKLSYLNFTELISPSISFGMRLTGSIIIFHIIKSARRHLHKS